MSAGQTLPSLLRHAAVRTSGQPHLRLACRHSTRHLSSKSAPTASPTSKRIQTWQAVLLGSLTTVALQGVLLYGNSPKSPGTPSSDQVADGGVRKLEGALKAIHDAGIETSVVQDVLQGYSTAPGTSYPPSLPLAVVYPTSTEDVVRIVNACRESNVRG